MNRLVLLGNGFDLAHGLKTRYEDFISWYWCQKIYLAATKPDIDCNDLLCKMTILTEESWFSIVFYDLTLKGYLEDGDGKAVYNFLKNNEKVKIELSPFFERIQNNIETKGWVDIENDYYELLKKFALEDNDETKVKELNEQLNFIQDKLIEYLTFACKKEVKPIEGIEHAIYGGFKPQDIAIARMDAIIEHIEGGMALSDDEWKYKLKSCGFVDYTKVSKVIREYRESHQGASYITKKIVEKYKETLGHKKFRKLPNEMDLFLCPFVFYYPNNIMVLNFNYTNIAELYNRNLGVAEATIKSPINHIHGILDNPKSVIFGYGDEMDEKYKEIVKKNDNQYLVNIKSIKYLEAENYRNVLNFIESEPYQIIIMGHSCGNSDRTLLNTLFEHRNCVSIKPYYYKKEDGTDNYLELVQNISRNFTDMKLMRDRVVNKIFCEPLTNNNNN